MRRFPSSLLQFTSRERLPSYFAIGMMIGAIWYFSVDFEPSLEVLVICAMFAGILVWSAARFLQMTTLFVAVVMAFAATIGALAGSAATHRLSHVQIERPTGPVLVEGWVTRADPATRGVRVVIRVHAVDGLPANATPSQVRLTHIARFETEPGRFVRCWSVLRPPPAPVIAGDYAFDRQAWYAGLGAVGYVQGRCQGGTVGAPTERMAAIELQVGKARRRLAQHVRQAAGERAGGFAAALASGDRSFLSQSDQEALRGAGLAHLLAISGLHVGIVGGLVFALAWRGLALIEPLALRGAVKKPAAAAALIVCAVYLVISGASVSTQRAFVMAVVLFGAVLLDRSALTQRSLAIAMIIIIVIAPWSVLTPGFQMSFAATLVLITTYEAWTARRQAAANPRRGISFWFKSLLVTSSVTSLATMPFALYHFERVAGLGIIANTLAMPIISLLSAPLAACALLMTPFGLDEPALRVFGLSLEWVLAIAHMVDGWALTGTVRLPKMPGMSLALFSLNLIVICLLTPGRVRSVIAAGLILAGATTWLSSARDRIHWAPSGDVYLEPAFGGVQRIGFHDGEGLAPLRFADIAQTTSCAPAQPCELQFAGATVVLLSNARLALCEMLNPSDISLVVDDNPDCPRTKHSVTIAWSDVERENGITLERRNGRFQRKSKPACDSRPWRRCPSS